MGAALRSAQLRTHTDRQVIHGPSQPTGMPMSKPSPGSAVLARKLHTSPPALAAALADAFLAQEQWATTTLVDAGALVVGSRRRWLGALAAEVLRNYPRPPRDAPRELAAVVLASEAFSKAMDQATLTRKPLPPPHFTLAPRTVRDSCTAVPALGTVGELANYLSLTPGELEWFADPRHFNRAAPTTLQHYRYQWHRRDGRVPRLLEIPAPRLRTIQRSVLAELLSPIPLHPAAHGFVPGRSVVTGAAVHTGKAVVVNLDLSTFFAKVSPGRVYGVLRQAGFPEAVAHRLTGLCTHRVPARILNQMPHGGSAADRFALRQALTVPHLPQGAPTSPLLANLAVRRMDSRLTGWAQKFDAGYTRYADDLAFGGGRVLARGTEDFMAGVQRIVAEEGHRVNPAKSRIRGAGERQSVTGVVVNEHPNVKRTDFDQLKAILHNCTVNGPASQNLAGQADFRAHLRGRIAWVAGVNPQRGQRLLTIYDRISW